MSRPGGTPPPPPPSSFGASARGGKKSYIENWEFSRVSPTHPPAPEEEDLCHHYDTKQAGSCLLLLFLFSPLFGSVFPKERERPICTVVVCLTVVALCQTGNLARFLPKKEEHEVDIGSNAENVTEDGRESMAG